MALPNLPIKTGHLFIGLAAVMGVLTLFLFSGNRPNTTKTAAPILKTRNVVVPIASISQGKILTSNDVTAVKWPSDFLPKREVFEETDQVVGRVARQDLFPGEPLFREKLSGAGAGSGLPALIPSGMRAVSVAVTEVKGVAGFVKPGVRVDVLSTFEIEPGHEGGQRTRITKTVLQNALVLASAQTMVEENKYNIETPGGVARGEASTTTDGGNAKGKSADAKSDASDKKDKKANSEESADKAKAKEEGAKVVSSVTLALTPAQAETLALAEETGEIRLALRPESDNAITHLSGATSDQLFGITNRIVTGRMPTPPVIPSRKPPVVGSGPQVEFIQGTEKTLYAF